MEALEMIKGRRSVRKFTNKKVDRDVINEVVTTTTYSPSWMNAQITRFYVIDDADKKAEFAKIAFGDMEWNINTVSNAAGVIVMSYVKGKSGYDPKGNIATSKGETWGMYDAGIAGQTLSLALHEKGLGSVTLGVFDDAKAGKFIDLSENEIVAAIIPYGYADGESKMPPRMSVKEVLTYV